MKCDYTHLNHNLLIFKKKKTKQNKSGHQGRDYKGQFVLIEGREAF
jgi:hypothetical protein